MGIRTLHRRTPEFLGGTRAEAGSASGPAAAASPVPALAPGARVVPPQGREYRSIP
ncbi:hypothetical protein [Streptomyces sp. NPDC003667]